LTVQAAKMAWRRIVKRAALSAETTDNARVLPNFNGVPVEKMLCFLYSPYSRIIIRKFKGCRWPSDVAVFFDDVKAIFGHAALPHRI
jgi:hypothetical protein